MKDGVNLSARLWLPETGPAPAIVEYIPYRKRDMVRARDERNHPWFAARGYACIRVDMRGSGDSEGVMQDMYMDAELDDCLTMLEWISKQHWCDGAIGMMGTSWGGTSSLQAAISGSGLLKAVIAVCATNDRYNDDIHHMGGCLLTDSIEWGATLPAILALPPSIESNSDGWRDNWLYRLDKMEFPLFSWIEHETRDSYWRHASVTGSAAAFDCPVLAIGGWSDRYSNTVMNLLEDNPDNSWGIVGPWGHHFPDQGIPGPAIGFQQEALQWWDRWLRGEDNGFESKPRLRVWCNSFQTPADFVAMRDGHWFAVDNWIEATASRRLLKMEPVLQTKKDTDKIEPGYMSIPTNLRVGGAAGDTGYFGRPGGLPLDQVEDNFYSLVFESLPLDNEQLLLGKAIVSLDLKIRTKSRQIVIRLNDVAPDGRIMRVSYRVHNLKLDGDYLPDSREMDKSDVQIDLSLTNAAHIFAAGHRIQLALSTSYWPVIWPSAERPEISVDSDSVTLEFPLAPEQGHAYPRSAFPKPLTIVDRDPERVAERIQREKSFNDRTGELIYRWAQPLTMVRHDSINVEIGATTTAEHIIDINDPLSAASRFVHKLVMTDGEQHYESEGRAEVQASHKSYRVKGSLEVRENGDEIYSRDWSRTITRRYG